jgi:hypothetical protein
VRSIVEVPYTPEEMEVTITNNGEQATGHLTVTLTGDNNAFTLDTAEIGSIAPGEQTTFTVSAKTCLDLNYYESEIAVKVGSRILATFSVNFLVATAATSFDELIAHMDKYQKDDDEVYVLLNPPAENAEPYPVSSSADWPEDWSENWPVDSPAKVVIDGNGSGITVGPEPESESEEVVTLTLRNITFKNLPFTVQSGGTLMLEYGAVIRDNTTTVGVAVDGGTLTMYDGSEITNNSNGSSYGGGVRLYSGTFTMNGGEISGNSTTAGGNGGGGVALTGTAGEFTMKGGKITHNSAHTDAGVVDIFAAGSKFTMEGGEISHNVSNDWGGGGVEVYSDHSDTLNSTFNMSGGIIKNNTAGNGGGVWSSGTFNMKGGEITGNTKMDGTPSDV